MNIIFLIVALFSIVVGIGLLGYAGLSIRRGSQRTEWSLAPGKVTTSEIKVSRDYGENTSTNYFTIIRYKYEVNRVEYESDVISASEAPFSIGTEKHAKSQIAKYQLHSNVLVYYNPNNPQEAVLEKTKASNSGMALIIILGLFVLMCGAILLIAFLARAGLI